MTGIEVKWRELCNYIVTGEQSNGFLGFQRKIIRHHLFSHLHFDFFLTNTLLTYFSRTLLPSASSG